MKNRKQKYPTVATILKYNIKIVERCKIDTPNTNIPHDHLRSCLGTVSSTISGRDKLLLWDQACTSVN